MWNKFKINKKPEEKKAKRSPFHEACKANDIAKMQKILKMNLKKYGKEKINDQDYLGNTGLHYIVCTYTAKSYEALEWMLNRGAKTSYIYNKRGLSPFHHSIKPNNEKMIRKCLEINADLEGDQQQVTGYTPLCVAIVSGFTKTAKWMITELRADIHHKGINSLTPFQVAVKEGNLEIASFLIEQGADPMELVQDETPILNFLIEHWKQLHTAIYLMEHLAIDPFVSYKNQPTAMEKVEELKQNIRHKGCEFIEEFTKWISKQYNKQYKNWLRKTNRIETEIVPQEQMDIDKNQDPKISIQNNQAQMIVEKEICHVCGLLSIIPYSYKICSVCLKDIRTLLKHNHEYSHERTLAKLYDLSSIEKDQSNKPQNMTNLHGSLQHLGAVSRHQQLFSKFIAKSPELKPAQSIIEAQHQNLFSRFKKPIQKKTEEPVSKNHFWVKSDPFRQFARSKSPEINIYASEPKPKRRKNYPPLSYYETFYADPSNQSSMYMSDIDRVKFLLKRNARETYDQQYEQQQILHHHQQQVIEEASQLNEEGSMHYLLNKLTSETETELIRYNPNHDEPSVQDEVLEKEDSLISKQEKENETPPQNNTPPLNNTPLRNNASPHNNTPPHNNLSQNSKPKNGWNKIKNHFLLDQAIEQHQSPKKSFLEIAHLLCHQPPPIDSEDV